MNDTAKASIRSYVTAGHPKCRCGQVMVWSRTRGKWMCPGWWFEYFYGTDDEEAHQPVSTHNVPLDLTKRAQGPFLAQQTGI